MKADLPKGMLKFEGETLIERQIDLYKRNGIGNITIATGYRADRINYPDVNYSHNPNYSSTNMVETLLSARSAIKGDVIVSYADIVFESHSTSLDNENHLSSGWNDVELSPIGIEQARDLGERRKNETFNAIFCSDLQRSYKTAEIAFGNKFPIIRDERLRECNYGDLTQSPSSQVTQEKVKRIDTPFPNGESYEQTSERMKSFLKDLAKNYSGKKIMIIGHRATQYGLEQWIKGIPLQKIILAPWKWQPGWEYKLESVL